MKYCIVISITSFFLFFGCKRHELSQGEIIVNTFYKNKESENFKDLDTLMSFRFYQNTPYKEFIHMLSTKNKEYGKINKKSLAKYKIVKSTKSTDTLHFGYEVDYMNVHTKESFTLIQEDKGFKILKYYVSLGND
ncbi:hypothetical protein [Chryseobacterium gregarium]|uniref:hypothetical protein n=1 Tax=Chryseobacterium gregarium TaxID=456299 RepID=UPI000489E5CC|nr:hypothetical protein [Chryseobacterium gregarium]